MSRKSSKRANRGKQNTSANRLPARENKPYDRAVLLVHGIGNQKLGGLTSTWGREIGEGLCDALGVLPTRMTWRRVEDQRAHSLGISANAPYELFIKLDRPESRPMLVLESNWSRSFRRPSGLKTTWWVLRSLPMLTFVLGFDRRDLTLTEIETEDSISRENILRLMGVFGRVLVRIALLIAMVFSMYLLVSQRAVVAAVLGGVLLVVLSIPYFNVIGHVKVAATSDAEYEKITNKVQGDLDVAKKHACKVSVVAHSQGGFIVHDVLSSQQNFDIDHFFGIGSGLKPITLLRSLQDTRELISHWALLGLVLLIEFASVAWNRTWGFNVGADTPGYLFAVAGLNFMVGSEDALAVQLPGADSWFTWSTLATAVILLGSLVGIRILFRIQGTRSAPNVSPLAPSITWKEISSNQDIVGRSLYPPAPEGCSEVSIPVAAHPLVDHVGYFRKGGLVPRLIAQELVRDFQEEATMDFTALGNEGEFRLRRAARLRTWLAASIVAITVLPMVGTGGLTNDQALLVSAAAFTVAMILTSPLLIGWQVWTAWRLHRAARQGRLKHVREAGSPTQMISRAVSLWLVIGAGILTCASASTLESAGIAPTQAMWGVGAMTLFIGVIVGAGYWSRILMALGFWLIVYAYSVITAPPALPQLPFPFGQAGLLLSIWCLFALSILMLHRSDRVSKWLSELTWRGLGLVKRALP